jgi:hypothetical protein
MNPLKQSIGANSAEFLRMAIRKDYCIGYLPRSVASTVSGSWINERELNTEEFLRTSISNARTLINRSQHVGIAELLLTATLKRVPLKKAVLRSLLRGEVSLGAGPIFGGRTYQRIDVVTTRNAEREEEGYRDKLGLATRSYLQKHAQPLELYAAHIAESGLLKPMLAASYRKTLAPQESGLSTKVETVGRARRYAYGVVKSTEAFREKGVEGILSKYPLLNYLKGSLKGKLLTDVLVMAGWDGNGDPYVDAWGSAETGTIVRGYLSYSDASHMSRIVKEGVIHCNYQVCV